MSVIEFPQPKRDRIPSGTIVAVRLDALASVALIKDKVVKSAARAIKPQKRLVIIDIPFLGALNPVIMRHRFYQIGSGLPAENWASVPILPGARHPEHRRAVQPTGILPLEDASVHTAYTFEGTVSRIHTTRPSGLSLSPEDTTYVFESQLYDRSRLRGESWDDAASDLDLDSDNDDFEIPEVSFLNPHYEIWLHIEGESYADPSTLRTELDQLRAIEEEWRARRKLEADTKNRQLEQWRDKLDPDAPAEVDIVEEVSPHDDLLSPEDAVDSAFDEELHSTAQVNTRSEQGIQLSDILSTHGSSMDGAPVDPAGANRHLIADPETAPSTASYAGKSEPSLVRISSGNASGYPWEWVPCHTGLIGRVVAFLRALILAW